MPEQPAATEPATRSGNALLFARNFLRHPRMLGSIVPSSRFLIGSCSSRSTGAGRASSSSTDPGWAASRSRLLRHMRADATLDRHRDEPGLRALPQAETISDRGCTWWQGSAADVDVILRRFGVTARRLHHLRDPLQHHHRPEREQILRKTVTCSSPVAPSCVYQFSTRVLRGPQARLRLRRAASSSR